MYRDHKRLAATEPRDNLDPDPGPPSAFDYANMDLLLDENDSPTGNPVLTTVAEEDRGLREQAYVLWDMERMKDYDLWYQIETAPESSSNGRDAADVAAMHRSWSERADIWRQGGSGMWNCKAKRGHRRTNNPPAARGA